MPILPSKVRPASLRAARRADSDYGVSASPNWRDVDWREHLHSAEVDGRRVNYVDIGSGDGPPVVFIHGLGGAWQNWLENLPRVAQERRAIALDLPGHGQSEMPAEKISISGYGRCVDALTEQLGFSEVALVGNSMGGFIAAEMAIQFPERVAQIVLVSPAGITTTELHRAPALTWARTAAALGAWASTRSEAFVRRPGLRHAALNVVTRHPSKLAPDMAWEMIAHSGKDGFVDATRALLEYDFRDRLPEIRCPTLIVWGNRDALLDVGDADEYERLIPDSRKVLMEDTGHMAMLERPVAFNDCLLEFLHGEIDTSGDSDVERAAAGEEAAA
ncbi:MAG: alpha/beta fold hydrolase [Thermoleophilaceae bacterium]